MRQILSFFNFTSGNILVLAIFYIFQFKFGLAGDLGNMVLYFDFNAGSIVAMVIFNCFLFLFGSNDVALHILDRFSEIPPHASLVPVADLHWWDVLVQSQSNDVCCHYVC